MPLVHLNLGSNQGNRLENLHKGVDALRRLLSFYGGREAAESIIVSSPVESEPWGFESECKFINIGLNLLTNLSPYTLLDITREAERSVSTLSHRNPDGSYRDRLLDIDIIFYGDLYLRSPRLQLPHPHWRERDFVLIPLRELNPTIFP